MRSAEIQKIFDSSAKSADRLQGFVADMHVERAERAYDVQKQRREKYGYITEYSKEFDEKGIVVIPNFMSDMIEFVEEIEKFPIAENKNEHNLVFGTPRAWIQSRADDFARLYDIVMDCHALPTLEPQFKQNTFVQRHRNIPDDNDVQKTLHMDTFFTTIKFWFFPEDVTIDDGPFRFVEKSNILTDERKEWMRQQWQNILDDNVEEERTYGHAEGSLRVFEHELLEMNLSNSKSYSVEANTLVVANTFGFHARGQASTEKIRQAVHGSIRLAQPFQVSF